LTVQALVGAGTPGTGVLVGGPPGVTVAPPPAGGVLVG